jgi:hypothetical protein
MATTAFPGTVAFGLKLGPVDLGAIAGASFAVWVSFLGCGTDRETCLCSD